MVRFICGSKDGSGPKILGIGLNDADFDAFTHKGFLKISLLEILHSECSTFSAHDELFLFHDSTDEKMLSELKARKWDMTNCVERDFREPIWN